MVAGETKEDDDRCVGWARALFRATETFALGTAYINFMTE